MGHLDMWDGWIGVESTVFHLLGSGGEVEFLKGGLVLLTFQLLDDGGGFFFGQGALFYLLKVFFDFILLHSGLDLMSHGWHGWHGFFFLKQKP